MKIDSTVTVMFNEQDIKEALTAFAQAKCPELKNPNIVVNIDHSVGTTGIGPMETDCVTYRASAIFTSFTK